MSAPAGHVPGPGGSAGFPGNLLSRPPDTRTHHLALHEALRVLRYENQGPWTLSSTPGADGSGRCRGPGRARGPDTRPSRSPPQTFRPPRTARGGPEACSRFRPASRRQYEDITASIPERTRVLGSFITAAPGGDAITGVGGCPRPPLRAGRRPRAPSRRGREGAAGRRAARRHALGCTGVKGEGTGMAGVGRALGLGGPTACQGPRCTERGGAASACETSSWFRGPAARGVLGTEPLLLGRDPVTPLSPVGAHVPGGSHRRRTAAAGSLQTHKFSSLSELHADTCEKRD